MNQPPDLKDHLANERTFLAWLRTSIALMAFGFVVMKFSLFLRHLALLLASDQSQHNSSLQLPVSHNTWGGIFIVAFGVLMAIFSYWRYRQTARQIEKGSYRISHALPFWLSVVVVVIGIYLVVYLLHSSS
ncbi:MAG: DUF202 domain-containing protein [Thermoflavifilum aggregans]|nr:DUF202 domain-containing protein [Thermoflavifilum aggregans]